MSNRNGRRWIAGVAVLCLVTAACGMKKKPAGVPETATMSMDVASLWEPEAATDPVAAYKVRVAGDPGNPGLHNNLGNAYVLRNKMEDAIKEYQIAAELDPLSPVPWNNIGTVYRKTNRTSEAQRAFERAIQLDKRYALAYYNLGTIYDAKGDYDKAINLYGKAISLNPDLLDLKYNPQVLNNKHMMVVQLRRYLEETGNTSLPIDRLPE